jgi:hypothetical protein
MTNETEHARFLDVLCAAIVTLWFSASVILSITILLQDHGALSVAITASFFLLFAGAIPAFVFGGLISFPFWWVLKRYYRLTKALAGGVGAFTGFILSVFFIYFAPADYSGTPIGLTQGSFLNMLLMTLLGAVSGWNGYRVAWNGRKRKTRLTQ